MFEASDHSFVVCAYQESPYLRECVSSLLAQTAQTHVAISTATPNDLIRAVAEEAGVPLYVNPSEPGIGSDWNFATAQAKTPLVTLAHQDDVYAPTYAERMLRCMNKVSNPLIFFSDYGEIREGELVDNSRILKVKRGLLRPLARRGGIASTIAEKRKILRFGNSICCPSVTLALPSLPDPPFDTSLKSNLDWLTWEGYSRLEGSFVYDQQILMYHRIHEGSTTTALIHDNTRTDEDLSMLEKFWPKPIARLLCRAYALAQTSNGQ